MSPLIPVFSIPYAPYSKSDKLGRFADWNESEQNKSAIPGAGTGGGRAGAASTGTFQQRAPGGRGGQQQQVYGAGTANYFAYTHVEDEASFSLVDNKIGLTRRLGAGGASGRGRGAGRGAPGNRGNLRGAARVGYPASGRGAARGQIGGRGRGWRDWDKVCYVTSPRTRQPLYYHRICSPPGLGNHPSRYLPIGCCSRRSSFPGSQNCASMSSSQRLCS